MTSTNLGSAIKLALYFTVDRYTGGQLRRWRPATPPLVIQHQLDSATDGLVSVATQARRDAPRARVVLVDYLPMLGDRTRAFEDVPFDAASIEALAMIHEKLTAVFAQAADTAGVGVIRASQVGRGHELGTDEPWIQPLQPIHRLAASFHPNAAGMRAVAELIQRPVG
jgi:hypothetical protein